MNLEDLQKVFNNMKKEEFAPKKLPSKETIKKGDKSAYKKLVEEMSRHNMNGKDDVPKIELADISKFDENQMKDLASLVDNGTTYVTIPTPDNWKCERENCYVDYRHTHGTYPIFEKKHD